MQLQFLTWCDSKACLELVQVTKGDAALASSITLNVLKRTDVPVLVTKPSTPAPMTLQGGLRAMLAVEHTARPLLKWLNTYLVHPSRGDKLLLARVGGKDPASQVCCHATSMPCRAVMSCSGWSNPVLLGSVLSFESHMLL